MGLIRCCSVVPPPRVKISWQEWQLELTLYCIVYHGGGIAMALLYSIFHCPAMGPQWVTFIGAISSPSSRIVRARQGAIAVSSRNQYRKRRSSYKGVGDHGPPSTGLSPVSPKCTSLCRHMIFTKICTISSVWLQEPVLYCFYVVPWPLPHMESWPPNRQDLVPPLRERLQTHYSHDPM